MDLEKLSQISKKGYFIEQELQRQATMYRETFNTNLESDGDMESLLQQTILSHLKMKIGDYAKYECLGCQVDHPSQIRHEICLMTSPEDWIRDYNFHEPVLENLNIYDVIEDFDENIWIRLFGKKPTHPNVPDGIDLLTPEECQEVYKYWTYFKENQRQLTEEWKTYWANKLVESYQETS